MFPFFRGGITKGHSAAVSHRVSSGGGFAIPLSSYGDPMRIVALLAVFTSLSISLTVHAKAESECAVRLEQTVRSEKWQAQREQIRILEKKGSNFRNLIRAYRSLVQDLFSGDAEERARNLLLAFPGTTIMSQLDMSAPASRFTEDLIRVLSMQLSHEGLIKKLHILADLEAEKLSE
jgi:hypothetical protein